MTRRRAGALAVADVAAKVALVGLLVSGLVAPDLAGIKAHAAIGRLVVYPLGAAVVPLWWLVLGRRRRDRRFPWLADLLITLPWLLDTIGNRAKLFDLLEWWDELMHVLNWFLLTLGVLVAWRAARRLSAGVVIMVALGFGSTAALVWELLEYLSFGRFSTSGQLIYRDTLGDMVLGCLGSLLAVTVWLVLRRRRGALRSAGQGDGGDQTEVVGVVDPDGTDRGRGQ